MSNVVKAERFVLTDSSGQPRAELACGIAGTAELRIFDARGAAQVRVGVQANSVPFFALHDHTGEERLTAAIADFSSLSHAVVNAFGNLKWQPSNPLINSAVLVLKDAGGNGILHFSVSAAGECGVVMSNPSGANVASLGADPWAPGACGLSLSDSRGRPCIVAGVSVDGAPYLSQWNRRPWWRRLWLAIRANLCG